MAEGGRGEPSPQTGRSAPAALLLQGLLDAAVGAYAFLLLLAREFIDAQLRALSGAGAAGGVRRERVKVE
ncbi:MAG: hypothetical protein QXT74_01265 [Candidatus Nezhaarchaeales archaeon]